MAYETKADELDSLDSLDSLDRQSMIASSTVTVAKSPKPTSGWLTGWRGLVLGIGLGAAISTMALRLVAPKAAPAPTQPTQTATAPGQSVTVDSAKLTPVVQTIPAQGTIQARDWVSVLPKAAGVQIQELRVDDGDRVTAGQVIAVLDNSVQQDRLSQAQAQLSSAQAQLSSAQAQLASAQTGVRQKQATLGQRRATLAEAESNLRRYQSLQKEGAITQQDLESRSTTATTAREGVNVAEADVSGARADVNRAQAGVNQAQAEVRNSRARVQELETQRQQATFVQAPATGIIAKKAVKVGDLTGTTPLFSIIGDGALELQVKVPENLLSQIKFGALAQVTSDADKRITLQGRVRDIDPTVDEKTRQAIVKIDLPANSILKPGMFLKAAITVQTAQAITVPATAVQLSTDGRSLVYVLDNTGVAQARSVEVGPPPSTGANARIEVKSGLKVGDRVIVSGAGYVKEGDRVTVVQ